MPLTSPLDIIKLALKDAGALGVGQTPLDEDVNDAFDRLNGMISLWARKRWLIFQLITVSKISTGAQSYSVGPGGDFDMITRPDSLEAAFLRQNPPPLTPNPIVIPVIPSMSPFVYVAPSTGTMTISGGSGVSIQFSSVLGNPQWVPETSPVVMNTGDAVQVTYSSAPTMSFATTTQAPQQETSVPLTSVDFPMSIITSREDYNSIPLKGLQAFSYAIFYEASWPLGRVWPYPSPLPTLYSLNLTFKLPLTQFANLTDPINLPPEYKTAIHYNLAERLRAAYQLPVLPGDKVAGWARDSLNTVRMANVGTGMVKLKMPREVRTRGGYNIYSDRTR